MKTTNPDLTCRWCKQYQETQEHIITECTMTADILVDIDLNKAMMNHKDTLIKEATQRTQIANQLDKPPDTDIPILDLQAQTSLTDPYTYSYPTTHLIQADPQTETYQTDLLT